MLFHYVFKMAIDIEVGHLLKNLNSTTFEVKMSYYPEYDIEKYDTFMCDQTRLNKEGE